MKYKNLKNKREFLVKLSEYFVNIFNSACPQREEFFHSHDEKFSQAMTGVEYWLEKMNPNVPNDWQIK